MEIYFHVALILLGDVYITSLLNDFSQVGISQEFTKLYDIHNFFPALKATVI